MTSTEDSVLGIVPVLEKSEAAEMAASEQVAESKRVLRVFDQQVQLYKPLADHAATALSVVQRLSNTFKYFGLDLDSFEQLLATLFTTDKKSKVPDNAMAITGHVLHLKPQLLVSLMSAIRVYTFTRHQRLLPLFISLETLVTENKLSQEEYNLLAKDLDTVERQLDMLLSQGDSGPVVEKPKWITDKVYFFFWSYHPPWSTILDSIIRADCHMATLTVAGVVWGFTSSAASPVLSEACTGDIK